MSNFATAPECGAVAYSPEVAEHPERETAEKILRAISGVQGVGEGRDAIGNPAWIAYVADGAAAARLPSHVGSRAVVVLNSGIVRPLPAR
jgi:hypothetical protein